jgi:hypothetical protein
MKDRDLILITAHCPDIKRENPLRDLVISLQGIRGEYDIMISSHTCPYEEVSKVEIIVDSVYLNSIDFTQPGFKDKFKAKNYSQEKDNFRHQNGLIVNY